MSNFKRFITYEGSGKPVHICHLYNVTSAILVTIGSKCMRHVR